MHYVQAKQLLLPGNRMNLYRGCVHGCIYCDSRSKIYGINHVFEDIEVKANAIELLEDTLSRKRNPCMVSTGSMTDPYIPQEMELRNVRKALEIIYKYHCGAAVITKSTRVLRDLDLYKKINAQSKVVIQMTLTTVDPVLCSKLEPNVSNTQERFEALKIFRDAGIPTVVWLSPILPFINDTFENLKGILDMCAEAKVYGIICFGIGMTLREGNREYFYQQLDRLYPGLKEKYIYHFGDSYTLRSPNQPELMNYFYDFCREHHIVSDYNELFDYINTYETKNEQLTLF